MNTRSLVLKRVGILAGLLVGASLQAQVADFGDAPHDRYPTLRAGSGAFHLQVGREWIGPPGDMTTSESDALGTDADSDLSRFMTTGGRLAFATRLSFDGSEPALTRYLSVLVDLDGDGRWEGGEEAPILNYSFSFADFSLPVGLHSLWLVLPLESNLPLSSFDRRWMRVTLATQPVSGTSGAWGGFARGETEDRELDNSAPLPPKLQFIVGLSSPRFVPVVTVVRHGHRHALDLPNGPDAFFVVPFPPRASPPCCIRCQIRRVVDDPPTNPYRGSLGAPIAKALPDHFMLTPLHEVASPCGLNVVVVNGGFGNPLLDGDTHFRVYLGIKFDPQGEIVLLDYGLSPGIDGHILSPASVPCRPGLFVSPPISPRTLTWSAALGGEIGQVSIHAGGPVGYVGAASVRLPGRVDFDPVTFTWGGPGTPPVPDGVQGQAYTGGLVTAGDEFQVAMSSNGLVAVLDQYRGAGGAQAVIATRTSVTLPFVDVQPIRAPQLSFQNYVDPSLGVVAGRDVLFWNGPQGDILIGEIDVNPVSPGYGTVSNPRTAVPFDPQVHPGLSFWFGASPIFDSDGETRSMYCSGYFSGGRAVAHFVGAVDGGSFDRPAEMVQPLIEDPAYPWLTNPATIEGRTLWANSAGLGFGEPLLVHALGLSSAAVPRTGGPATLTAHIPLDVMRGPLLAFFDIGSDLTADTPQAVLRAVLGPLGLIPHGDRAVIPLDSIPVIPNGSEIGMTLPVPAIPFEATIHVEAVVYSAATQDLLISNKAVVEVR